MKETTDTSEGPDLGWGLGEALTGRATKRGSWSDEYVLYLGLLVALPESLFTSLPNYILT